MEPNPRCLPAPKEKEDVDTGATQSLLGDFVKSTPKWTKEGLLEHIVEFVVLKYQQLATKEEDIPKHQNCVMKLLKKPKKQLGNSESITR